ncbi:MAG: NADH-quinone oxidoreductase subunit C, partial [Planctomycetes bacterium]|nr:NADH-quinone oxidoreductase subunit C [Planctomycetota bacterium]
MKLLDETVSTLKTRFDNLDFSEFRRQTRVVVPAHSAHRCLEFLKDEMQFDFLSDITCVDYLNYRDATDRFGLAY